jgi:hypothetical protein
MADTTWRPAVAFRRRRNGQLDLSRDYYAYLRHAIRVTPEERKQWDDLGVHLTQAKERRLECLPETYEFLIRETNHK